MKVAILGAGYVGLVTGACLAKLGHRVTLVDRDAERIDRLRGGSAAIFEPDLDDLLDECRERIEFETDCAAAVANARCVVLAVGTPGRDDGAADLRALYDACQDAIPHLRDGALLLIKSTVPPGTARTIGVLAHELASGRTILVASNPEFLREGRAVADFLRPDRIVIGSEDPEAIAIARRLYGPLIREGVPLIATASINAELIKLASNAFLAMKVAFVNELSDLCAAVEGNISEVAEAVGRDGRIGPAFLAAGPGFGGSCFPKDTGALAYFARRTGAPLQLVEATVAANDQRLTGLAHRVAAAAGTRLAGLSVAVLGLAFKKDTDDLRDSPAVALVRGLQLARARVRVHDPEARATGERLLKNVEWCADPYEAARGADVAVIATEWDAYRGLDLRRLAALLRRSLLVDFRNLFEPSGIAGSGLRYVSIGRPPVDGRAPDEAAIGRPQRMVGLRSRRISEGPVPAK